MATTNSSSPLGLTVSQAANELGVSVATVRRWSNAGFLKGYRTPGGQRRFTRQQIEEFLESLEARPPGTTSAQPPR